MRKMFAIFNYFTELKHSIRVHSERALCSDTVAQYNFYRRPRALVTGQHALRNQTYGKLYKKQESLQKVRENLKKNKENFTTNENRTTNLLASTVTQVINKLFCLKEHKPIYVKILSESHNI